MQKIANGLVIRVRFHMASLGQRENGTLDHIFNRMGVDLVTIGDYIENKRAIDAELEGGAYLSKEFHAHLETYKKTISQLLSEKVASKMNDRISLSKR